MIQESTINQPLDFPRSTPETAKAKRDEIRQARQYLQEHTDSEVFHIGALPSSWTTEGDGVEPEEKKHASETEEKPNTINRTEPQEVPEEPQEVPETGRGGDGAPDSQIESQQAGSQYTALSISTSALASPPPGEEYPVIVPEDESGSGTTLAHRRPRTHARARIAAYLAARADTYSAWTDVSLVSAGDNHTEEEIEL
jgi:hypothetical protein